MSGKESKQLLICFCRNLQNSVRFQMEIETTKQQYKHDDNDENSNNSSSVCLKMNHKISKKS